MPRHISPSRGLLLSVICLSATFVADTVYSRKVATKIDEHLTSIAQNSAASVVYLARVTENVRLVSGRALRVRRESVSDDRVAVAAWLDDMDAALGAYRLVGDDPGERELFFEAESRRAAFLAALESAFATAGDRQDVHGPSLERLNSAADALAATVRELTRVNADEVVAESAAIGELRRQASTMFLGFRAITLLLAVIGISLALAARRQHVALVEASKRLAEARAKELEMFAGRVAHDLRGPLSVIEMKSSTADRTQGLDALKDALERIRRQGRRMAEIIDALLAFARAGARPEPETCDDISLVVREVIAESQSLASGAGIEFVDEVIPPAAAGCSSGVLGIVLSNLVRNAVKYIDGGSHGVRRITLRVHEQDRKLRFEVEDTGPGLPRGAKETVFEPFVRFSTAPSGGIGLGLATVKRLVEAHDGKVGVDSTPGRGCRFWFELPRAPRSSSKVSTSRTTIPPALPADRSTQHMPPS